MLLERMAQLQLESPDNNIILDMQLLALAPVRSLVDLGTLSGTYLYLLS